VDKKLLDLLCCPLTQQRLKPLDAARLARLKQAVAGGLVRDSNGQAVTHLEGALVTEDDKRFYPIQNGIAMLTAERALVTEHAAAGVTEVES
jgi:uncharacterized protein